MKKGSAPYRVSNMKMVKPEIWSLVQDEEIAKLIAEMVKSENLTLRRFSSIAEALGSAEPSVRKFRYAKMAETKEQLA